MPIKVRCKECQKVLKAPDKARGKAVKCPACGGRIRVPDGSADASSRKKSASRKKKKSSRPSSEDALDFLSTMNMEAIEDTNIKICPKCAEEVEQDDVECPYCGVVIETGQLSAKEKRKRSMKGPDPAEFYAKAWSDPWRFVLDNKKLILWTILAWTFFGTSLICCIFMVGYCDTGPPQAFWAGMAMLSALGMTGWYLWLSNEIVRLTFAKKNTLKKVQFDSFVCMSLGLKFLVWPYVLIMPFFWFPPAWFLPTIVFPIALTHFAMPYTYKAWLPVTMAHQFFKTLAPSLYWLLITFVINIFTIAMFIPLAIFSVAIAVWAEAQIFAAAIWIGETTGLAKVDDGGFMAAVLVGLTGMLFLVLVIGFMASIVAPSAVYVMRLTGLFGYYNQINLEIVRQQAEEAPAGFGPRYVAHLVDAVVLGIAYIVWDAITFLLVWGASMTFFNPAFVALVMGIIWIAFMWRYYVNGESGSGQATIGKHALGLIVTDMKGEKIDKGVAGKRFFLRYFLGACTFYISWLTCAFDKDKMTMHDRMTKTQVLWKGDDERN